MQEIKKMVDHILQFKPSVVVTEKGLSDVAAHHLQKAGALL
jgi:T-complex protein 1 subunit gamma